MKTFYYSVDDNNTMTIFDEQGCSIADISDCYNDFEMLIEDTLCDLEYINEDEEVNIIRNER